MIIQLFLSVETEPLIPEYPDWFPPSSALLFHILFSGHIPFYYAAMVVLTWGEISYMLAESPYMTRRIPSSHRGRIHGLMEIIRIGFMSLYQLLIGFIYKNHTPIFTWVIVLLTGVAFMLLAVILTKEDKKRYKNLYRRL